VREQIVKNAKVCQYTSHAQVTYQKVLFFSLTFVLFYGDQYSLFQMQLVPGHEFI